MKNFIENEFIHQQSDAITAIFINWHGFSRWHIICKLMLWRDCCIKNEDEKKLKWHECFVYGKMKFSQRNIR